MARWEDDLPHLSDPVVLRTETDQQVAWLAVDPPQQIAPVPVWAWVAAALVGLAVVALYPPMLLVVLPCAIPAVLVVWHEAHMPLPRAGLRVQLGRRGVEAVIVVLAHEPASALDGEVYAVHHTASIPWDALQRIDVEQGRILLQGADGCLALPPLPEAPTAEIVDRIRAHHAAFESASVSRGDAEAAHRDLAHLVSGRPRSDAIEPPVHGGPRTPGDR